MLTELRTDPALTPAFVEEILRYDSPVQLASRWAPAGAEVEGVTLPPGAQVLILAGAANRDPRRFDNPDVFDPHRPSNQPVSFGGGAHYCLGAALARLEGRIAFSRLLEKFSVITRAGEPVRRDRLTLRRWETLPVSLQR
ncbi:cytochrome P450 [Streptacidiphilus sp. MAP5-3]|uniref:cytochrome P450 n=1 Tax=unclassified Streptacidiphilus TaxID=2643834 RepID=UPI003511DDD4